MPSAQGWPGAPGSPPPPGIAQAQGRPSAQGIPPGYGLAAAPGMQMTVAPRNPAIALIVSFFIPGLGSMINGRLGIGVTILAVYIVGAILSIVLVGIPIAIGAWIWGMVDGYKSAQDWNRSHGILS